MRIVTAPVGSYAKPTLVVLYALVRAVVVGLDERVEGEGGHSLRVNCSFPSLSPYPSALSCSTLAASSLRPLVRLVRPSDSNYFSLTGARTTRCAEGQRTMMGDWAALSTGVGGTRASTCNATE